MADRDDDRLFDVSREIGFEDAMAIADRIGEMADRVRDMHAIAPGAQAEWGFEMDGARFKVILKVDDGSAAQRSPDQPALQFRYTNWRGETALRTVTPLSLHFGSTEWHPEPQWLLRAFDRDKRAIRDFALKDCRFGEVKGHE